MTDQELLEFHRKLVSIPSVSGDEAPIRDFVAEWLENRGVRAFRSDNSVYAVAGGATGPLICLNSHLDTVPAAVGWSRDPLKPAVVDGKVYGLGANDAKASVAAMVSAFLRVHARAGRLKARVLLTLVEQEETGSKGTERLMPRLGEQGLAPDYAIVGEPTGLDIAIAQKGLLILELIAHGNACHAAHRKTLGYPNAIRALARDLLAVDAAVARGAAGPVHVRLGEVTVEPTMVRGGTARNVNPAEASCYFDLRVNPGISPAEIVEELRGVLDRHTELRVFSDRLAPYEIDERHVLVTAALRCARGIKPDAKTFGSRGLSDLVCFRGLPAIKVGPGVSERSHQVDEFVLESELLDGARFYEELIVELAGER